MAKLTVNVINRVDGDVKISVTFRCASNEPAQFGLYQVSGSGIANSYRIGPGAITFTHVLPTGVAGCWREQYVRILRPWAPQG
jgi:hypothetical protein